MILKPLLLFLILSKSYAFYDDSSNVISLNANNFDKLVKNSKQVWVVEFFASWCGHCQNFASEYEKAAKALEGVVKVGAVNADENPTLIREYNVPGYPSVKIFSEGIPQDYQGERTAGSLVSFTLKTVRNKLNARLDGKLDSGIFKFNDLEQLTEANFNELVLSPEEMWLVVFYTPISEPCQKLSAQWTKVMTELKGMIHLGALDASTHASLASNCKITTYPSIRLYPMGQKDESSGIDYIGALKSDDIYEWVLKHIPSPEIVEIVDYDSIQKACDGKPLCVVSFLPHILDCQAECRNEYLNTLMNVSENYKNLLWGWVWSEAGAQPELEKALEIGDFGYPTMAAVSVKKMKYSLFVGSFSVDGINTFLRDLSFGRGDSKPITLKEVPPIETTEPWNGLNAELPAIDENDLINPADAFIASKDEL